MPKRKAPSKARGGGRWRGGTWHDVEDALKKITGRSIADEAREPALDAVMRARDRPPSRWNWVRHTVREEKHRVVQQVLLNCVKATPDSLFGDVADLYPNKAIEIAYDREKWKNLRPSRRC